MDDVRFRATVKHEGAEVGDLPWLEEFWAVRYSDYTALRARLEAVEKERLETHRDRDKWFGLALDNKHRAEHAEAALASARRDALEEAIHLMPRYFGVWSSTGVHIGVWNDGATAAKVLEEYPQGFMRDLIDVEAIRALANEAETTGGNDE